MKGKFKVGDRVIVNGRYDGLEIDNRRGRVLYVKKNTEILIEFDESFSNKLHTGTGRGKSDFCWWVDPNSASVRIELEPKNEKIIIYREGNKVIALDEANNKKAVARCNPEDKFDFKIGARLAFERLFEKLKYNARIVCVSTPYNFFTVGKIYTVTDGLFRDDDGAYYEDFVNIDDVNASMTSQFVELKED